MEGDNHDREIHNIHRRIHILLVSNHHGNDHRISSSASCANVATLHRNRHKKAIPAGFKVLDRRSTGHQ